MTTLAVADGTVDIGGTGQEPIAMVHKWNRERTIQLALNTTEKALITQPELGKYLWNGSGMKILWYPTKENRFEFEIILPTKPSSNVLDMWIDAPGLTFHPQPATPEDSKLGVVRPEECVDSLAIFHDKKLCFHPSVVEAEYYKNGSYGGILRTKIIGKDGKWAYCKQAILGNIYRITIPLDFKGTLPWIIDPTFGLEDTSAYSSYNWGGDTVRAQGQTYTPASNGTLTHLSWRCRDSGDDVKIGIWDAAHNLIDYTAGGKAPSSEAFTTQAVVLGASISSGTAYRIGAKYNTGQYVATYYKNVAGAKLRYESDAYSGAFNDPASWTLDSLAATPGAYATYTASGGAAYVPKIIMM